MTLSEYIASRPGGIGASLKDPCAYEAAVWQRLTETRGWPKREDAPIGTAVHISLIVAGMEEVPYLVGTAADMLDERLGRLVRAGVEL
jgi:hypothetical protein